MDDCTQNGRGERKPHDLYRLYSESDALLYVGISYSALGRLGQHRDSQPWAGDIRRMAIEPLGTITRQQAEVIERKVIWAERPIHNVVHNRNGGGDGRDLSFRQWLVAQASIREGIVGDLARDVKNDEGSKIRSSKLEDWVDYLESCDACEGAFTALTEAHTEWSSSKPQPQRKRARRTGAPPENHRWECGSCDAPIKPGHRKGFVQVPRRGDGEWECVCHKCDSTETPRYWIDAQRITTARDVAEWTEHLSSKVWFDSESWLSMLYASCAISGGKEAAKQAIRDRHARSGLRL
jgi:hypothetical protein